MRVSLKNTVERGTFVICSVTCIPNICGSCIRIYISGVFYEPSIKDKRATKFYFDPAIRLTRRQDRRTSMYICIGVSPRLNTPRGNLAYRFSPAAFDSYTCVKFSCKNLRKGNTDTMSTHIEMRVV